MQIGALEAAVIERMLGDPQLPVSRQLPDLSTLVVTERSVSEVGYIVSFARSADAKIFDEGVSLRWGKVLGRLNAETDVDFVIYVDDGYLTGVEACTFGGEPWPSQLETFELTNLPANDS